MHSINWNALCQFGSKIHNDEPCTVNEQLTMGANHKVRIVEFKDDSRWIARLRMPPIDPDDEDGEGSVLFQREVDCIQLVKSVLPCLYQQCMVTGRALTMTLERHSC